MSIAVAKVEIDDVEDPPRVVVRLRDLDGEWFVFALDGEGARVLALQLEHEGCKLHTGPVAIGVGGGELINPITTSERMNP